MSKPKQQQFKFKPLSEFGDPRKAYIESLFECSSAHVNESIKQNLLFGETQTTISSLCGGFGSNLDYFSTEEIKPFLEALEKTYPSRVKCFTNEQGRIKNCTIDIFNF